MIAVSVGYFLSAVGFVITGCVVAPALCSRRLCYVDEQWQNLTPYRIDTPSTNRQKFVTVDYVPKMKRIAKFSENQST